MSISEFISNNYTVAYHGPDVNIEDFSNTSEFLLCDKHDVPGYSMINSLFINTFANADDAVLVEGISSMQQITRDGAAQSVFLTTEARIFGWDIGNCEKIFGMQEAQQSSDLAKQVQILVRELFDPTISNKKELQSALVKTILKAGEVGAKMCSEPRMNELIQNSFPSRVISMQDSLLEAQKISSRTFLIAGTAHLIPNVKLIQDANLSLPIDNFLTFISTRNVVVLVPKEERGAELAAPCINIIMEALKNFRF